MAVTQEQSAPYATTASIIDILARYRNRGMPTPVTKEVLGRAGVSDSLIPRTLQSLLILDLIDDEGKPTDILEGMRLAPEGDYKKCLELWIRSAYADVFAFIDPSQDDETAVRDAFRSYKPVGQQDRMVLLFLGLCAAAGLIEDRKKDDKPRTRSVMPKPAHRLQRTQVQSKRGTKNLTVGQPPAALAGLLESLPAEGDGWTTEQRNKFYHTFGTVLDFCFPITEQGINSESDED